MHKNMIEVNSGTVLLQDATALPLGCRVQTAPFVPGWQIVRDASAAEIERSINKAGWHFFYLVPKLNASVLARDANTAVEKAITKLIRKLEKAGYNGLEIEEIRKFQLLWLRGIRLKASARHLKENPFLLPVHSNSVSSSAKALPARSKSLAA